MHHGIHNRLHVRDIGVSLQRCPAADGRHVHLVSIGAQHQLGLAHALISDAGEERDLEVRGLFYGIGHTPNSHLVEGQIELDDKGYVKVSVSITNESCGPL